MTNITRHITDRQNIITSRFSIIMLCFSIITLSLLNITFLTGTILGIPISTVSALSYQNSTDVSFTFDPILSIFVSPDSITIPTIAPGTTATSNTITVNVSTNTAYGYSLLASAGNNTQYNTSDLIHNDNTIDSTFTSIATNASLPTLDADNTWGYSTSLDNGSTWSTYHGLPLYSTVANNTATNNPALLIDTTSPVDNKSISFRIAARSSSTQPSGAYSNVINFYAVGKPEPLVIGDLKNMQDFHNLADTDKESIFKSMPVGQQYQLIDSRDNNTYWLAKLADGNIWMTQNLDLCIGCEGTATLTSQNTDLNTSSYPYSSDAGYSETDGVITWSPVYSATTSYRTINGTTVSPAFPKSNSQDHQPYSAEGGDIYVYTSNSNDDDTIYTSLSQCANATQSIDKCAHYHVGNYYNWFAAVATNKGSGIAATTANSICPSGWRLPIIQETTKPTAETSEFWWLLYTSSIIQYNYNITSYIDNGFNKIRTSPLYLVRGGYIDNDVLEQRTNNGRYWSSIGHPQGIHANQASFNSQGAYPKSALYRLNGLSVRCLVRQ